MEFSVGYFSINTGFIPFPNDGDLVTAAFRSVIKVIDPMTGTVKTSVSAANSDMSSSQIKVVHTLNNSNVVIMGGDRGDIIVWRL